jgi:ketosteroid isomerase-like protein
MERDKTVADLLKREEEFARATAERGLEGWLSFFAEDGAQLLPNQPVVRGHAAIAEAMAAVLADRSLRLSWEPVYAEVARANDVGFTYGDWRLVKEDEDRLLARGKFMTVWRRGRSGEWEVVADIGNRDD